MNRLKVTLAATALAVSSTGLLAAAPAQAAAACKGPTCNGQSPTKCQSDAVTVKDGKGNPVRVYLPGLAPGNSDWVDLRYSPSCRANWARLNPAVGNPGIGFDYYVYSTSGGTTRSASQYSELSPNYTEMVDGTGPAWICIDGNSETVCSQKF